MSTSSSEVRLKTKSNAVKLIEVRLGKVKESEVIADNLDWKRLFSSLQVDK